MELSAICKALGNAERVQLVACLASEASVTDLLRKCSLSQSALSQHLAILRDAEMVKTRRDGKKIYYKTASSQVVRLARSIMSLKESSYENK